METQAAVVEPQEGGTFLVHSSTQTLDGVQSAVARVLGTPANNIVAGAIPLACLGKPLWVESCFWQQLRAEPGLCGPLLTKLRQLRNPQALSPNFNPPASPWPTSSGQELFDSNEAGQRWFNFVHGAECICITTT